MIDIFNSRPRKIVCVSNSHNTWGTPNGNTNLVVESEYMLTSIEVSAWYSIITLEEFPDIRFNSVLFRET